MDADLFYADKKTRFRKYPDTCGRGLILQHGISLRTKSSYLQSILISFPIRQIICRYFDFFWCSLGFGEC